MKAKDRPRVLLADDHHVVAEGLARLLDDTFDVIGIVHTGERLVEAALSQKPDVILSDVVMPGMSGIEALLAIRAAGSTVPVLFLSMHSEPLLVQKAFAADAAGFLPKEVAGEMLNQALREVLQGRRYLSPGIASEMLRTPLMAQKLTHRQQQVLAMISEGRRTSEIAETLKLSRRTVESHRQALMEVLDVHSSITLIREAERLGLLTTD
jgi:DNA-binding NarL/FixJ family response regulator